MIAGTLAGMKIFSNDAGLSSGCERAKVGILPCPPRYHGGDDGWIDDESGDDYDSTESESEDDDESIEDESEEDDEFVDDDPDNEEMFELRRKSWERRCSRRVGSFEDETTLGPMRYTHGPIPSDAHPDCSLQFFYIKVKDLKAGLNWPLHVYGCVATRDSVDHKRNFLFKRTRDNFQTLTQKDPFLLLTGPSRAVVLDNPVTFEVQLKLKGNTESEDEVLALKSFNFHENFYLRGGTRTSTLHRRSKLEFAFALLEESVEATVSVQVVDGSLPDHFSGKVVCHTRSMEDHKMILLDSRDGKMPVNSDGTIELSRRVVAVDCPSGKLVVSLLGSQTGRVAQGNAVFRVKASGTSEEIIKVGLFKARVTVAWSMLPNAGY